MGRGADLTQLPAAGLSARLERGEATSVALMEAVLDRIGAVNGAVNAVVSLRPRDALMAEAAAADATPRKGWLHGIPVAVKDLVAAKGIRTTWGSPLFGDFVPVADDLVARRLRASGAILIGKTNTPEWGLGSHSFNPVFGVTRNPYDLGRSAGGSSGGAAAALAARMVPVADGSDMMGSLRNPAAFCNVYGYRPTWGLVPQDADGDTFLATLSTEGPMGRCPEDVARLLEVLAGETPEVPFPRPNLPFHQWLDAPVAGARIGWLGDWGGAYPMETGILDLCRRAMAVFEAAGCSVEDVPPPCPAEPLWRSWTTLRAMLNAGGKAALYADPAKRAQLKPEAVWEIEQGIGLTAQAVYEASVIRSDWYQRLARLFETYDALVLPSAQVWPFPVGWRHPTEINGKPLDTYHRWMEVAIPVSLAGAPALACPAGFGAGGLPMGFQLFGRPGNDIGVLRLGQAYHHATDWPGARPPVIATG
ncbi:MAG: amidase [Pseudomonadota bacterium]